MSPDVGLPSAEGSTWEDLVRVGTWGFDFLTGEACWSTVMRQLGGISPTAPPPDLDEYVALVAPEDRERVERELTAFFNGGKRFESEHRLLVDGQVRVLKARGLVDYDEAGFPYRAWGATQDITDLRNAEDDLAAERNMSRALLAALADGYVYASGGVIRDVNDVFCELTGYRRDELIGLSRPYRFATLEEVAAVVHQSRSKTAAGATVDCEMSRRDGTRFHAELTVRPVFLKTGSSDPAQAAGAEPDGYVTVLRDVTTTRAEHIELLNVQRMLTEAQTQAKLGSWGVDLATEEVTFTPQMYALCGLSPNSPAPSMREFQQLVHPDDRPAYQQMIRDALRTGEHHSIQHRLQLADGTVRHIYGTGTIERDPESGRALRVRGSAQDVTERVEREQALAASEEQFRLTQAHSPIGLALVGLDGTWLQVNDALCRLVGYSREHLLGSTFQQITHPDDLEIDVNLVQELMAGTRESYQLDKRYRHGDGHDIWVSLHAALVRGADGAPLHFISQVIDISHRYAELEQLTTQAGTDALTGLPNRRTWEHALTAHCSNAASRQRPLAIAILDLDYFKIYNDTYGHPAGDQLLIDTSAAWNAQLTLAHPRATLARIGGEEFALALPDTDADKARAILGELLELTPGAQTTSAGVTLATPQDDPRSLMTRADAALYAAKHQGRNRCEILLIG